MPWRTITTDDITGDLTPVEIATLQNLQGANDQLAVKLTDTINEVRDAILAGGGQLDQDGTVPDMLRNDVINITRWLWLASFPQLKSIQTPMRQNAFTLSRARIDNVSTGKPKVPPPANPLTTTKSPVNAVAIARPGHHVRTHSFDRFGTT
jgi:hypothetical protein